MVGDPGIEPGMGHPGGVTVHCRTLQRVAQRGVRFTHAGWRGQARNFTCPQQPAPPSVDKILERKNTMKKPQWVIDKERSRRAAAAETLWLFGLHAVRDALGNPARERLRLVLTRNAADRLADVLPDCGMEPEIADPRKFPVPLDPGSVHQGAALEVKPLNWGSVQDLCAVRDGQAPPVVVALDRVTDPHNVGAILRSAEVFGARAVIAPHRHSAPETGALAKTACGALERQPYLRVRNLSDSLEELKTLGYDVLGLDGDATSTLASEVAAQRGRPVVLVLGAEGPGLRERTRETCDVMARIPFAGEFGSLNVSNAAAVSLYAITQGLAQGAAKGSDA